MSIINNALTNNSSIEHNAIQESIVKNKIIEQENIIAEKRQLMISLQSEIRLAEETRDFLHSKLKNSLASTGVDMKEIPTKRVSYKKQFFRQDLNEKIMAVFKEKSAPDRPLKIPEITDFLINMFNISISVNTVVDEIEQMEQKKQIECVNSYMLNGEKRKRGMKYIFAANHNNLLNNFEINKEHTNY